MSDDMQDTTAIVPYRGGEIGLFEGGRSTASGLVQSAADIATALAGVIKSQGLASNIQGRSFVKCEGWLSLARMNGCLPFEVSNETDPARPGVYVAVVQLRTIRDGQVIAQASAECGDPDEVDRKGDPVWANRPAYARRSMAATRATSKVCRLAFSWIMAMAGYEVTPAEEVPADGFQNAPTKATIQPPQRASAKQAAASAAPQDEFIGGIVNVETECGTNPLGPWTKFVILCEGGLRMTTFSKTKGEEAQRIYAAQLTARIQYSADRKWGPKIESIESIEQPGSDVPF